MVTEDGGSKGTLYSLLQVHSAAPIDLISAAYWRLAAQAHAARVDDASAGHALIELTHAYRVLADPSRRRAYDISIGLGTQALTPSLPPKRRSVLGRLFGSKRGAIADVDYFELLRVDPSATTSIVNEAYPIIRGYYLRLVRLGEEPAELLDLLEEAYAVTSDPERRMQYEQEYFRDQAPLSALRPT
jgi:DnaJ-class molecular chaperone